MVENMENDQAVAYDNSTYNINFKYNACISALLVFHVIQTCNMALVLCFQV